MWLCVCTLAYWTAPYPSSLLWLSVTTVLMWSDSSGGKNRAIHWVRRAERREAEPVICHAQSTAIFSYRPSLKRAQLPLSHAIMKSSINSKAGKAEAACCVCYTIPTHCTYKRGFSFTANVCPLHPHCNKLTRNSYYVPLRDETRQSAPALPWMW